MADLDRIKRNVAKMAGMNAPEADIDAYIAQEGVTVEQIRAHRAGSAQTAPTTPSPQFEGGVPVGGASGVIPRGPMPLGQIAAGQRQMPGTDPVTRADEFVRGVADTVSFGAADELAAAAGAATGVGGRRGDYAGNVARERERDANASGYRTGGQVAGAIGGGFGLARSGWSASANAIQSGRPLANVATASALEGGILAGAHGFGSAEGGVADRAENASKTALVGAAGGLIAPYAIAGASAGVRRAVTPFRSTPERQSAVDALKREGVEISAGQVTGNRGVRYAESEIGGDRAADLMDRQADQFTAAVLRRVGIDAPRATPEVLDGAFNRIGRQFDDLASRNALVPDNEMMGDIGEAVRDYASKVPGSMRAPIVQELVGDLRQMLNGRMDGSAYQSIRSRIDRMARSSASDPELSQALYGIRSALDDGMERSIAMNNPADAGAWQEVRRQYRNILVVERAATGAGEKAAAGIISPGALRNATVVGHGRRNYARGKGDFAELARAGSEVLSPLPDSGTASRMAARGAANIPALTGALLGQQTTGDLVGGVLGAGAGFAATQGLSGVLMSRMGQRYLANQMAAADDPLMRALLGTSTNSGGSALVGRR